ncbi:MAG: FtsX-like permease family protein [Rhodobacteraceae bacterium]|nr:FtsX-like permease family protein [Paracoccaceae bacterium]
MNLPIALRLARRELRGGVKGFRVFLACLALGVAAIAAVGSVRDSIEAGLAREGAVLLGGDAEIEFTYRFATDAELGWMQANALRVSETVDFRSMVVVDREGGAERGLTQVRAVDDVYPIYGRVRLDPPMEISDALDGSGGLPGAAMDRVLMDRLGLAVGDRFSLGTAEFVLSAVLLRAPDDAAGGFGLGPPTMVRVSALEGSGLLQPGSLFETEYRVALPQDTDLDQFRAEAEAALDGIGWRDKRDGTPGASRFVERLSSFLVIVGLAGLAVGGVGVAAAVRSYLQEKTPVIATLKSLGAERGTIFAVYFLQIMVLTFVGLFLGIVVGATLPMAFAPLIEARLPVPVDIGVHVGALSEAALYGALSALVFSLWPIARTEDVRPAALFRDAVEGVGWPRPVYVAGTALALIALVGLAALFSGVPSLAIWAAIGVFGAFLLLLAAASAVRRLARWAAGLRLVRGRTSLRLALGAVGGPGGEAASVVLSLGLGLSVIAAVGQIDANLRAAIAEDLPEVAPSYFVVDIQNEQLPGFLERVESDPGVSKVETAPMLRGYVSEINGRPAEEVAGDHWVVRGDRGITYSARPPENAQVVAGEWWPEDYDGPPQMSFSAEEAEEIGLKLGDMVTVNILGRDITAEITSFRNVDFSTAGIGFVLSLNPNALAGAPHTHIATIYAEPEAEAPLLRDLAGAFPNITAIRVRDAIDRVAEVLRAIASATTYAALVTLATGAVVLIGAAVAGERGRTFEAAVLKTLGAERRTILASFALRSALLGAAAGGVAILAGGLAGWGVMTFVMEGDYRFEPLSALAIVSGGVGVTLVTGLIFAWGPLARRPAGVLRARE